MSTPSANPALRLTSISRKIGGRQILGHTELMVHPGEFVCLVGPSGCGKSTLLHIIGGFTDHRDYEGEVLIDGQLSRMASCDKAIVFQENVLFPWLTVLENIAYGLMLRDMDIPTQIFRRAIYREAWAKAKERARIYLEKMRLKQDDAGKMIYEISGGMRQRVDIAAALILEPKILLMDEPFSGLDPQTREVLRVLMKKVHAEEKNAVLFITHDLEEAVFLGTRVVVLSQYHDKGPGARIVLDVPVPFSRDSDPRLHPDFGALVKKIREAGFSPAEREALHEMGVNGQ